MKKQETFILSQVPKKGGVSSQDTFRILVATDNHVGYRENDPIRGKDSFNAFEEVLMNAKEQQVDFLLLGGDLFHDLNPSPTCMYGMINLLGQYVLGDGEINFEMPNYNANFHDTNLNIELPIFIIHGNHDYPSNEQGNLSVLDLLHSTKYLNHFGKFSNLERIKVTPIIFTKASTTIALYGIGYMKDRYFHKLLEEEKIEFVQASELGYHNTVNILVIHQNRYKGIRKNHTYRDCVHPEQFPNWIHLIIRGHEHGQVDEVKIDGQCPIQVIQPGSTIATSIIPDEATPRRSILFEVNGLEASYQDIILMKSYRPILYDRIDLNQLFNRNRKQGEDSRISDEEGIQIFWKYVENSIFSFRQIVDQEFPDCKWLLQKKPLMRFKVTYSDIDVFNYQSLETKLSQIVSNPGDIFKFTRQVIELHQNKDTLLTNPKLQNDFIKTLKDKDTFDTIGNDAASDIKDLYEERLSRNTRIFCLPSSLIMSTMETDGARIRYGEIEQILGNLQEKLNLSMTQAHENQIKNISQQYKSHMKQIMDKISLNIDSLRDVNPNNQSDLHPIKYQISMNSQFDEIKTSIGQKIREKVSELYYDEISSKIPTEQEDEEEQENNNQNLFQKRISSLNSQEQGLKISNNENQLNNQKEIKKINLKNLQKQSNFLMSNEEDIKTRPKQTQINKIPKKNTRNISIDDSKNLQQQNIKNNRKNYGEMFQKQYNSSDEEPNYDENIDQKSEDSDCEMHLEGDRSKQYEISHISQFKKNDQSDSLLVPTKENKEKERKSAPKIKAAPQGFTTITKKSPAADLTKKEKVLSQAICLDIKEYLKKKLNESNSKN